MKEAKMSIGEFLVMVLMFGWLMGMGMATVIAVGFYFWLLDNYSPTV